MSFHDVQVYSKCMRIRRDVANNEDQNDLIQILPSMERRQAYMLHQICGTCLVFDSTPNVADEEQRLKMLFTGSPTRSQYDTNLGLNDFVHSQDNGASGVDLVQHFADDVIYTHQSNYEKIQGVQEIGSRQAGFQFNACFDKPMPILDMGLFLTTDGDDVNTNFRWEIYLNVYYSKKTLANTIINTLQLLYSLYQKPRGNLDNKA